VNPLVGPLAVSVLLVALDSLGQEEELKPRTFAGVAAVFVVLSIVAEKAPDLAESFAWLIVVVQFTVRGPRVAARLGANLESGGAAGSSRSPSGRPSLQVLPGATERATRQRA
jgi:hypothetical protein